MSTSVRDVAVGALVVVAVAAAVLVDDGSAGGSRSGSTPPASSGAADPVGLETFDGCDQLNDHVRAMLADASEHDPGLALGQPVVQGAEGAPVPTAQMARAGGGLAGGDQAAALPAPATADGASATNVQEAGVDEPDIVDTDGRLLLAVTAGELHVVDVADGRPRELATVALDEGQHELFLVGDRALVMTRSWRHHEPVIDGPDEPALVPAPSAGPTTALTLIDLRDPAAPVREATATVDGELVSARAVDGTARLVLRSWPHDLDLRVPTEPAAAEPARRHNRAVLASVHARHVLPDLTVRDRRGRLVRHGPAVDCRAVSRPSEPSGVGTTTVLTLRVGDGDLVPEDSTSVLADSQVVYASVDRLYVATSAWSPRTVDDLRGPADRDGATTELHAFETTGATTTRHVASGSVAGRLLNQWSLSERDGVLRVAVTRGQAAGDLGSDSAIVTLTERGGRLAQLGEVDGLGPGERIYAVRYLGDLATVVTFRETDPLYTVDLSDPSAPAVLGELKIPGFSDYLHPVGEDRLVGVGQDATGEGQPLGVQVSLFDIGDLAAPRRTANLVLGPGSSEVQYDHHAFLWWPEEELAVLPVELWGTPGPDIGNSPPPSGASWVGAVLVRADRAGGGLREVGRVSHSDDDATGRSSIRRAVVVGPDTLLTVSEAGVEATDPGTLETRSWLGF